MCGITAIVTLDRNRKPTSRIPAESARNRTVTRDDVGTSKENGSLAAKTLQEELYASLQMIVHRGPDAEGVWTSPEGHVGNA